MSRKHLITAATADLGTSIDAHHRALMEDCLHASLRDVRLHFSSSSCTANQALGSLAFAVDNHICFRTRPDPTSASYTYLLAHELTHILQKRRVAQVPNPQSVPIRRIEYEADTIAAGILAGIPAAHITADPSSQPRFYGPAGHYYTAFYTAMAVGLQFDTAFNISFFTQLPDLVCELDAEAAGYSWNWGALGVYLKSTPKLCADHLLPEEYRKFWRGYTDESIGKMVHDWQIQAGLHALTGGNANQETEKRTRILLKLKPSDIPQFGLAVHAFGDSFAHRDFHDGSDMYGPPYGHGAETVNHILRADGWDPHDPDRMNLRQPLYIEYGKALYHALSHASASAPAVALDDFLKDLRDVASKPDEKQQAALLKEKLHEVCMRREGREKTKSAFASFYQPKSEAVPWAYFQDDHPTLTDKILDDGYRCAAEWCGSAEPFKISVHYSLADAKKSLMRPVDAFETALGLDLTPEQWISRLYGN